MPMGTKVDSYQREISGVGLFCLFVFDKFY